MLSERWIAEQLDDLRSRDWIDISCLSENGRKMELRAGLISTSLPTTISTWCGTPKSLPGAGIIWNGSVAAPQRPVWFRDALRTRGARRTISRHKGIQAPWFWQRLSHQRRCHSGSRRRSDHVFADKLVHASIIDAVC